MFEVRKRRICKIYTEEPAWSDTRIRINSPTYIAKMTTHTKSNREFKELMWENIFLITNRLPLTEKWQLVKPIKI